MELTRDQRVEIFGIGGIGERETGDTGVDKREHPRCRWRRRCTCGLPRDKGEIEVQLIIQIQPGNEGGVRGLGILHIRDRSVIGGIPPSIEAGGGMGVGCYKEVNSPTRAGDHERRYRYCAVSAAAPGEAGGILTSRLVFDVQHGDILKPAVDCPHFALRVDTKTRGFRYQCDGARAPEMAEQGERLACIVKGCEENKMLIYRQLHAMMD